MADPASKAKAKARTTPGSTASKTAAKASPKAKSKTEAKPKAVKPASKPSHDQNAPPRPAPAAKDLALLLGSDNGAALERLSSNLARAALTAQGALAGAALKTAENPAALNPDPFNAAPAMSEVIGKLAAQPDRLFKAQTELLARYMDLWQSAAKRIADGETSPPVVTPAPGDRRFKDADWDANPMFDVIKQSYLLSANWLNDLVGQVEDVDPQTKRRAEFFMKFMTDALAPSNFLISNPVALREAIETEGESLVRGMDNFAADLERGQGSLQISQTDASKFEVGVNVASTPGKVVFQNELIQLLQFNPTTDEVFETPLVIFPPWINKYYILDLRPDNSMIRWLTQQGFTVFVVSWVNPDAGLAERTFEDYMTGAAYAAIEAALKQTGAAKVNVVGYCIAGTLLSCTLAHMAAKGDDRVASATFFAAQQDFSESGDLSLFTEEDWLRAIEVRIDEAGGVLPGRVMSDTFNSLRANDLIWSFFVGNYLLGKEPKPFDLLFWNSDQTRMPKALHMFYLRRFYKENALAKGELELGGEGLDLSAVKTPIFVQSAKEDHIAPYRSVYRGLKLFGGPKTFIVAGSGHIAGVINAPAAAKYQYWTNSKLDPSVDDWFAKAEEHPGSWWPHWVEWLAPKSGPKVAARNPAKGPLKPIEDAPGSFVRVKS
ncbi:MAG TPA: class I poly(R)-hydroxyalkanoic acid synthase [Caulobacteraceae bacterium]|nr:class I poly(R)-hydroxyalkanoic acid synthase [Caulobacteraceae bacterium]